MKRLLAKFLLVTSLPYLLGFVPSLEGLAGTINETRAKNQAVADHILHKYKRQFTMLILMADNGEFLDFSAQNGNAVNVVVDRSKNILNQCLKKKYANVVLLSEDISLKKLKKLSECEHFDVTIATGDFLARYKNKAQEAVKILMLMGDHVIIDLPRSYAKITNTIQSLENHTEIYRSDQAQIFHIQTSNPHILKNYWSRDPGRSFKPQNYLIESDFEHKVLIKCKHKIVVPSEWIAGINLDTFCGLSGTFPEKRTIVSSIYALQHIKHDDIKIHNMVIQGKRVRFIDIPVTGLIKEHKLDPKYRIKRFQKIAQKLQKILKA